MAEISYYWSNEAIGDGVESPYSDDEFSDIWRKLFVEDRTTQGVLRGYANELEVTNPAGTTIRVATGAGMVDGKFYETDAVVDNAIAAPAVATRKDRVVLQKSWAAQTVRVAILTGVEGGGVPALTQTDGVTWEIPLATITITTGSAITITDERAWIVSPLSNEVGDGNWVLIEEKTLAGTEASIIFTNIPQDYRSLILIGMLRHQRAAVVTDLGLRFNYDGGANYSRESLRANNATPSASAATGQTRIDLQNIVANNGIANHVSFVMFEIPYYKDTTFYKTVLSQIGTIPNVTVGNYYLGEESGIWANTNAIVAFTLYSPGAPATAFVAGCKLALYGVP